MSIGISLGAMTSGVTTGAAGTGSSYVPLSPYRLLDTRLTADPLGPGGSQNLTVTSVDSVPAAATAVVLNVTVTGSSKASYVTVYPAGETTPNVSNLNFTAGETVANLAVVQVGASGQVTIFNSVGTVQVIVDLEGYFELASGASSGSYAALPPARITDTRAGSGEPNSGHPLTQEGTLNVQVDGVGGVPSTGVSAVALNVTVTDPTLASYLTAFPTGIAPPLASNLNWWAGDTLANRVFVPVGAAGQVSFYNSQGDADLVVDVVGYFSGGSGAPQNASLYYPMSPIRLLDTRADAGTLEPESFLSEQFAGVDGISTSADAVVANLTATNATQGSFFSLVPQQSTPGTSDLNFAAGQTIPNLVVATLNTGGGANIYNALGSAAALVDVFGYFQPDANLDSSPAPPCTSIGVTGGTTTEVQATALSLQASASCPSNVQANYEYWYKPWYSSVWSLAQSWVGLDAYTYDTSTWTVGTYDLAVWVSSADVFQSAAATTYEIFSPDYQYPAHVIPPEATLVGDLVNTANEGLVAGCYSKWAAGRGCDLNGTPGQCTFWAELNWASPYFTTIAGNADQLPASYTTLTGFAPATTPSVGALAVFSGPGPFAGSTAGHVMVVTSVAPDGSSYTVSQMNWSDESWDISSMTMPFDASSFATQDLMGFLPAS